MDGTDHRVRGRIEDDAARVSDPEPDEIRIQVLRPAAEAAGQMIKHHLHGGCFP
jgi:hypothetical protein